MAPSAQDVAEEQQHFADVISTFRSYAKYSLAANNRRRKDTFKLALADQQLLEDIGYKAKLDQVDKAIIENAKFLGDIIAEPVLFGNEGEDDEQEQEQETDDPKPAQSHSHDHGNDHGHNQGHDHSHSHGSDHDHGSHGSRKPYRPTDFDMDKLRSTLKQFVRDWSEEGKAEREASYRPLKDALLEHFSDVPAQERANLRVLVPGAGLGRLAFDVAQLGFASQGNEFSHYMLLGSFFVLNKTDEVNKHTFYPYVHSFSNISQKSDLLRPVSIPDVLPSSLPEDVDFSLVAGDFEEVYGGQADPDEPQAGAFNAILTCFFIDTSQNIVNYLRTIYNKLSPGGVWINIGPLLWHWENNTTNVPSIELDLEEVKELARKVGFEISNERTFDTTYTNNAQSMLGYVYKAAFWTATKKA